MHLMPASPRPHTLIALLQDRPGVLHRTVTLLRRRGFNIVSLAVGRSEVPGISRMTLVVDTADATQVVAQLDRLVEVIGVTDVTLQHAIERETALAKVIGPAATRQAVAAIAAEHGAAVVDQDDEAIIVECSDSPERVEAFLAAIRPHRIAELMRTGRLAMQRGRTPMVLEAPEHYRAQADGAPTEEEAA
jgi:acetolactate synthase-1/3 small subunit